MSLQNNEYFKEYDLMIVSPGGCCHTLIYDLITRSINEQNIKLNMNSRDDNDNLKHISDFKNSVFNSNKVKKILYIYRNTLSIINSHFRRNWYKMQYKKISKYEDYNSEHLFDNKSELFENCLNKKKDISNVSQHVMNWSEYKGDIYFLNIDYINKKSLFNFLGFKINDIDDIKYKNTYIDEECIIKFYKNIDDKLKNIFIDNNKKYDGA